MKMKFDIMHPTPSRLLADQGLAAPRKNFNSILMTKTKPTAAPKQKDEAASSGQGAFAINADRYEEISWKAQAESRRGAAENHIDCAQKRCLRLGVVCAGGGCKSHSLQLRALLLHTSQALNDLAELVLGLRQTSSCSA